MTPLVIVVILRMAAMALLFGVIVIHVDLLHVVWYDGFLSETRLLTSVGCPNTTSHVYLPRRQQFLKLGGNLRLQHNRELHCELYDEFPLLERVSVGRHALAIDALDSAMFHYFAGDGLDYLRRASKRSSICSCETMITVNTAYQGPLVESSDGLFEATQRLGQTNVEFHD